MEPELRGHLGVVNSMYKILSGDEPEPAANYKIALRARSQEPKPEQQDLQDSRHRTPRTLQIPGDLISILLGVLMT